MGPAMAAAGASPLRGQVPEHISEHDFSLKGDP